MKHRPPLLKWIAVPALSLTTPGAAAGSTSSVSCVPTSSLAAVAASPVPTLSAGLLIAPGLLLMVVAARALAANRLCR